MVGGPNIAGYEPAGPRAAWLRALMPVLLLALTWQSYVVGTHVHPLVGSPQATALHRVPVPQRRAPVAPGSCPICQQIAMAAAYLPAPPVTFALPTLPLAWFAVRIALSHLPHCAPHAWRSRDPPAATAFPS